MRVFFLLLVFAIGLSGYMSAAHAFCGDEVTFRPAPADQCCPGHDGGKHADRHDKTAGHAICIHCCAAFPADITRYSLVLPDRMEPFHPSRTTHPASADPFFLLRPPRMPV